MLGLAGAAAGATAACESSTGSSSSKGGKTLSLWYWDGGLSKKVVADAVTHFSDVTIQPSLIGGNMKEKLLTTMTGRQGIPDITGIKGEDIASFMPQANRFYDLNTLGFSKLSSQYLEWKWKQATTSDGKTIGFPIDIGPTALYYRVDVYEKAGLPTDPDKVAALAPTWDAYFAMGQELKAKVPGAFHVGDAGSIFNLIVGQGTKRFVDENNHFIGDQDHIRRAWDLALRPLQLGIDSKISSGTQDWNAGVSSGKLPSIIGPAWQALDIRSAAETTTGKWRVAAAPDGPANQGGSFLTIPKESTNPQKAFDIISWILSPDNEARGFTDAAIFPTAPATYTMPALTQPDEFFGGQVTIKIFGPAAQKIPIAYEGPNDAAVSAAYFVELTNVETKGKKPADAWKDAVSQAKKDGERLGVS
jgi:cellobiose transport system substrate-binding protein